MKAHGMKGMVNVVYAIALIVMLLMALSFLGSSMFRKQDTVQVMFDSDVYTLQGALDAAKLYLDTAARYSVQQAMYENGLRGGFSPLSECSVYEYTGKKYCLWGGSGGLSPSAADAAKELQKTANQSFVAYTKKSVIVALYPVAIPVYGYPSVKDVNGYECSVLIKSPARLSAGTVSEVSGDETTLSVPSEINVTVSMPYFRAFEIAQGIHASLSSAAGCSPADIEKTETTECCSVSVKVVDEASCTVMVSVKTKKEFLVWDGAAAAMEPVDFTFFWKAAPPAAGGTGG
ncbi:MAG: hypothetical protein V1813_03615 [Candidatus Aenigmatarchaeota archaeon]